MGKFSLSSLRQFLDTLALDTHDGVDLEFSHHVPCVEQKLFDPLRNPFPSWFGRVDLFPWYPGEFKYGNAIPCCGGNDVKPPGIVRYRKLVQKGGACKESMLVPCESISNFVRVIAKGLTLADG